MIKFNQAQQQYIKKLVKKAKAEERQKLFSMVAEMKRSSKEERANDDWGQNYNEAIEDVKVEIISSGNPPTGT